MIRRKSKHQDERRDISMAVNGAAAANGGGVGPVGNASENNGSQMRSNNVNSVLSHYSNHLQNGSEEDGEAIDVVENNN